ncbi:MAG: hypothetical protein HYS27_04010 [Deltaproteobacteria bacterium]|nr:hypothetical protein [Deltaproteobacteria bacterium]
MPKITRGQFVKEFKDGIDASDEKAQQLSGALEGKTKKMVAVKTMLARADKNGDGKIEGEAELKALFREIDKLDRDGSYGSVSDKTPRAIIKALRETQGPAGAPPPPKVEDESALEAANKALYAAEPEGLSGAELGGVRDKIAAKYGADVADQVMRDSLGLKLDKLDESGVDWVQRHLSTKDANIDRYQQALGTHLKGAKLIDSNFDGKIDAKDKIWTKGADGKVDVKNIESALFDRVRIGAAMIGAAESMGAAKHEFALIKDHTFNDKYWTPEGNGTFKLKPGVKPSEAFDDIFKDPKKYKFECATGLVIMQYKAMRDLLGKDDFDRVFPKLRVGPWQTEAGYDKHVKFDGGSTEATPERRGEVRAGDYGYFKNWDVSDDARKRGWQGENVVYLGEVNGERMFFGHPFGIASEKTIVDYLNSERNPGSTRSASYLDVNGRIQDSVLGEDKVQGD